MMRRTTLHASLPRCVTRGAPVGLRDRRGETSIAACRTNLDRYRPCGVGLLASLQPEFRVGNPRDVWSRAGGQASNRG